MMKRILTLSILVLFGSQAFARIEEHLRSETVKIASVYNNYGKPISIAGSLINPSSSRRPWIAISRDCNQDQNVIIIDGQFVTMCDDGGSVWFPQGSDKILGISKNDDLSIDRALGKDVKGREKTVTMRRDFDVLYDIIINKDGKIIFKEIPGQRGLLNW